MATFAEHLQNLRGNARASAKKAVDFMDGDQIGHLRSLLDSGGAGIKDWKSRGFSPVWENIVGNIIDKSATTYQEQPTRAVLVDGDEDEDATEEYRRVLAESDYHERVEDADMLARLLKTCFMLVQFDEDNDRLTFDTLSQHNCDVEWDELKRELISMLYSTGGIGPNGGQIYKYWTADKILELEFNGETLNAINPSEPNTYGFIPAFPLFDIRPPRAGVWAKPVWEQLVALNEALNMFHTETRFASRFGAIGSPVTNMGVPVGMTMGVDAILELLTPSGNEDITPFFEYRLPPVQVEEFKEALNDIRENVGREWGVNIKLAGEGNADSGFKLVVEELPGLMLRKKRQKPAATFEQGVYDIVQRMASSGIADFSLPDDGVLSVDFPAPDLPVNQKEEWEIAQGEMVFGVLTKKDYIKSKHPDWTDEQVAQYLADIQAEKAGAVPTEFNLGDTGAEEGDTPPAEDAVDPQTALNGAQVTALLNIVNQVTEGLLDKITAARVIAAAFPMSEGEAGVLLEKVEAGATPPEAVNDTFNLGV